MIIIVLAIAAFLLLALITYHSSDPSWSNLMSDTPVPEIAAGRAGAWATIFCCIYAVILLFYSLVINF